MIEILGRRIGERQVEENDRQEVTTSDTYVIRVSHRNVSRFVILDWPGLPQIGQVYSTPEGEEQDLSVLRRTLRQVDGSDLVWEMEVFYSTATEEQNEEDTEPLDRRPEVNVDFETYQTVAEGALVTSREDDDGRAVDTLTAWNGALTNSANEPFDPQPEMDQVRPVLNITFNEAFLNMRALMFYANRVNSLPWLGCPPRTWKMGGPRITRMRERNQNYWQISLSFVFNKDTWDLQILNQGTFFIDAGGDKQPFTDAEGNRIVGLLAADGTELAANADPTFERYRVYREGDFNLLFTESVLNL